MKNTNHFFIVIALILLGLASRFLPHAVNFTAVGATALFAGAYLRPRWLAFAIPLSILFLSDLYLGFYTSMWGVYLGFSAGVLIGMVMPSNSRFSLGSVLRLGAGGLGTGMAFFLISNFAVWVSDRMYPLTWAGLVECYGAALPFLRNQVSADVFYSFVVFAAYAVLMKNSMKLQNPIRN